MRTIPFSFRSELSEEKINAYRNNRTWANCSAHALVDGILHIIVSNVDCTVIKHLTVDADGNMTDTRIY